ncbi:hypothetical protein ACB092_10G050300 [Castanea dentata]
MNKDLVNLDLEFFQSKPREELQTNLERLDNVLKEERKKKYDPKISSKSLADIKKELLKLNQQISSINSLSKTFSQKAKVRPTSSGSSDRSAVHGLLNIHQIESFPLSSIYSEIQVFFNGLDEKRKFLLSCFSVFPENAVVKRRILVYWGLGEGYLLSASDTNGKTPEEIVDEILWEFQEKGLIEPAIRKRQMQVKSYRMDPLVRSAVIKLSQGADLFDYDSKGNVLPQRYWTLGKDSKGDPEVKVNVSFPRPRCDRMCLLKAEDEEQEQEQEQSSQKNPSIQKENLQRSSSNSATNLKELITLFNVNEPFPDLELAWLAKMKDKNDENVPHMKEPKAEDWLSKMENAKVICLGSWPGSVKSHVEVENTEFFKGLTNCKSLRFLSLQGVSRIIELPESIGNLSNLEILDLKECHNLEVLSEEITKLKKLKYLDLSDCYLLARMPKGLSTLVELRVLKGFVISNPQRKGSPNLDDLRRLMNLGKLTINANSRHFPTEKDLHALQELGENGALRKLTMAWGATLADQQRDANTEAQNGGNCGCWKKSKSAQKQAPKKQNLQTEKLPIKKLEKLDLQCFPNSTASWLTPDSLPDLKKLYIRGGNLATLDRISNWSNVQALRLKYLRELKMNWREMNISFPKLEYLEKVKCPGITLCPCDQHGVWMKNPN